MTTENTPTRRKAAPPPTKPDGPPSLKLTFRDGKLSIGATGDLSRIVAATGSSDVSAALLGQLAVLGSHGERIDEKATNFALGFIHSMKPRDAAELALLAQMAATHQAAMMLARRLNHVENIPQQDAAERAFNKLLRSYTAQMETLKRYRSKGQQVVRVERVTVESGAQAVVGSVTHGGRAEDET